MELTKQNLCERFLVNGFACLQLLPTAMWLHWQSKTHATK